MDATTEVEVGLDCRGHTVVRRMYCEVPMLVRVVERPESMQPEHFLTLAMVNGAAGPLGGDCLRFRLHVDAGARVAVCSVAAAIAQPGPRGEPSSLDVELVVGDEATLEWRPEPTVSVIGSDHRVGVRLSATSTSTVAMREGVSLGRTGEPSGRFALHERVTIDGIAVLDHETVFAPGPLMGPGAQGAGRSMTAEVLIGTALPPPGSSVTPERVQSTVHLAPNCALLATRSQLLADRTVRS
jgi:urease accessory protein